MTVTVIIVTLNRPTCVQRCLECLAEQTRRPEEVIVVDASQDDRTRRVVEGFSPVVYLRNDHGFGRMTASRNIGIAAAKGELIVFVDDDGFARPQWLEALEETYTDDSVGAVGGRVLNNQPDEAAIGVADIGKVQPNGVLTGFFAADPGRIIEVDHIMGCNMSYRRKVIEELDGFREDYPGISGVCEDTDMSLRVRQRGYRILFNPRACVDHLGAPQAVGRRFDARYMFFAMQNHCFLLVRNYGWTPLIWRFLWASFSQAAVESARRFASSVLRVGAVSAGLLFGLVKSLLYARPSTSPDGARRLDRGV